MIADIKDEISKNHSAYYLDRSVAPAPLLIANGFTDDLFPVDEAVRYANLVHQRHPGVPVSQLHFDFGHMRGQGKDADEARLEQRQFEWFDRYVKGNTSTQTLQGAEALTQTCPKTRPERRPLQRRLLARAEPRRGPHAQRAARRPTSRRAAARRSTRPSTRSPAAATPARPPRRPTSPASPPGASPPPPARATRCWAPPP